MGGECGKKEALNMRPLKGLLREEKGATMIMVAVAIVMIFGFAVLVIDMSLIQLAKTQLQNAADASALAGATTLAIGTGDEATATAEARAEAIRVAGLNLAIQDIQRPVVIGEDDVDVDYDSGMVKVNTHRREATGDPVTLYFLRVLSPQATNRGEMAATATARVMPISGVSCLRPWCIPDKWADTDSDHVWDPGEYYDPYITGYKVPDDVGAQVTIQPSHADNWESEWYFEVCFPPINEGNPRTDLYQEWISGCYDPSIVVSIGDLLYRYPGHRVGPTSHGVQDLINQDPGAEWDPVTNRVINSAFPVSPRVIKLAAFDPSIGLQPGPPQHLIVSKLLVLFVEGHTAADVTGRFMKLVTDGEPCPECPEGFLTTVTLVR
jgi:Flp pilus assembly protein TadG